MPDVPDRRWFDPVLDAWMHTGSEAVEAVAHMPCGADVAIDIETPGLDRPFHVNCVTAAWTQDGRVHTVLLDPMRRPVHAAALRDLTAHAAHLILHNCFAGDTRVMTREGVKTFTDIAGTTVEVWSGGEWRKAPARLYGKAPVRKVTVKPARYRTNVSHTFEATSNHRWPLTDGRLVTTDRLQAGDRIMASRPTPSIDTTSEAFKHGLIFADGALYSNQPVTEGVWGFQMRLCGAKAQWVHLFDKVTYPPSANGDPVVTGKLPFNPKALPESADADYIANFIEGWQALDGSDYGNGREVTMVDPEHADWLTLHAATAGWYATGRSSRRNSTSSYKPGRVMHSVILSRGDGTKPVEWRVAEVGPLSGPVPVYCVEVPDVERFTLAEGVYTGNSPFDVPALHHHGWLSLDQVGRIVDTLVLARFAFPDVTIRKNLTALSIAHLGWEDFADGMAVAFKAAGYRTQQAGYEGMDIDSPIYRMGAMADTVATLLLEPILREACLKLTLDHPFRTHGATTRAEAEAVLHTQEVVSRVMLRRTAVGLPVDRDYLDSYRERVHDDRTRHAAVLAQAGLEGGSGRGIILMEHLESVGELPPNWPRTATGKLKATKDLLDGLDHPLAQAQRMLADSDKILGYLEKVVHQAETTGRCHPQVGVLGASRTGRWSVSTPELHQFPKEARPIIVTDDGMEMWSIDWSQIEPLVLGLMARDAEFLAPYESGGDLYEPLMRAAGIDRNTSKTVTLALMYGQGVNGMAARIGHTVESASQIRRQILEAMPKCGPWIRKVQSVAEDTGLVLTAGGRILPCPPDWTNKALNWSIQGTAADVLCDAVCRLDEQGIGDSILIGMHDELVVQGDEELSKEVQQVMVTPPTFLEKWAGRTPILRTDRVSTGKSWAKV